MLTSAPTVAVAAPAQADSEDEPSELSYLTVVVTEDDSDPDNVVTTFTITWNDAENCSASYNAYLDGVVGDPIHLGSAASEGEQIAASLTNVSAEYIGFDAKPYCGTIGSGRLVDSLWIPEYSRSFDTVPISRAYLPKPGTYSTEPGLTVLTVSSGTLTPAFHSHTLNYTVPDVANADGRITLTTTTKADYYTVAFIPGSLYFYISLCSHGGQQTSLSYQDDTGNPLYPLTDADANTPGFQMDLDEGENVFKIRVWPNCENGHVYKLTVTRAANAPANTPATGAPTISGTAQVGETLTASTSGIADADGLTGATFSYQWLSSRDTEIQGATGAAYILVPGDAGKTIKVRVTFTDDEGNAETLTSAATGAVAVAPRPNSPATGAPTIGGTAQVGQTLTASTSGIADADGLTGATFSYQWLSSRDTEIQGATGAAYILVPGDAGKTIKVRVTFTDDEGNAETLTSAGTAVPPSTTPGEPQNLELTPVAVGTNGVGIKVFWDAPSATGGSDISGYRIQWKGGSQDYPDDQETRQAFVENAPYTIDTTSPTPIEGDELTVRIAAVGGAGAGVWTEKIGWLPSHTDLELWLLMKEYADAKQTTFPWVLETWKYLDRYEVPVEVGPTPGFGSVILLPCGSPYTNGDDGLKECHVEKFKILQIEDPKPRIIIHEMAHVYSLANRVTEAPGPLAIAHLYFDSLNLQGGLRGCEPRELYADVLTMLTLDIDESSYWKTCNGDNAQREAQALDVLRSAVDGEMPQWFADTYTDAEDEPDLERLWTDVQDLPRIERNVAVYQLRDAFGGYCNNRLTWKSMQYSEDKLTQPWMDGGCPPPEPSSLEVTPGDGELTLAWDAPASDGDSDVEGYIVQWKSAYHDWAIRQPRAVLDSPTSLTYTISGLGNGVPYDVRVRAYNAIGPGQPLDVESVTPSEPVIPNTPATGVPTISGIAQVGETLTVDTSGIADEDGMEYAIFTFFWNAYDATGSSRVPSIDYQGTYTIEPRDVGMNIYVLVILLDDRDNNETLISAATDAVAAAPTPNSPATGVPAISGTVQVGETLTANTSGVADADGLSNVQYEYQWLADDAEIGGATGLTYTLTDSEESKAITARVSFTDDAGNEETLTSAATGAVDARPNSPATGAPTIRGTAQVGETLTADITGIADADGMENDEVSFQWSAYDYATGLYLLRMIELEGTYTIEPRDVGMAISVIAIFTDDRGNTESLESAPTEPVAAAANTPAAGAPVIIGTAQVGETLTADTSGIQDANGLSGATFSYQWLGSRDTEIQGATNATYTLVAADEGKAIKVRVSFTDDRGNAESLTSAPTSAVEANANNPATGLPTISGTAQVGETLTAAITGIADADGLSGETFRYQWVSSDGTTDADIEKATDSTYKLVDADQGKAIKVRVTFTDGGGNEETLTSAPTGAVEEQPVLGDGPPGAPRNLAATAGNKEVTLSWDPPADNGNAPATGYRIEWRVDGKDYENHWGTARSTTYTTNVNANLANGVKYFFRVKAGNGSGNSQGPYGPASGEVSATPTSGSAVDLGTPVLSNTENLHHGMVRLDWEDVEDAGWYVVQYYHVKGGEWVDLPAEGVDIAFHGSSAVVSNLHGLSWLRVGAMSCAGESEWSQIEQSFGTNASDWEGVPVPEVEEGDEIEPCPVVLGTPVLSEPENLHHGMVRLDWQDIEDAGWYVVQYYHLDGGSGEWLDLPAEGVDIAFHGSSAVVSNLHGLSWLRVRAMSCAGASEWSQIEQLFGTNASDWEGVPVPEVAEGDEIEPCSEDADTSDNSPATGAPTISGTVQVGETLTANTSGIADADGLANATFSYQWITDDSVIVASAARTYTPTDGDRGKSVKVRVSFTDDEGNDESLTSANTATVEARANSPATGLPTISGTAQVGETLTANTSGVADVDGLSNVQYEYQWLANDSDISGATNATYTLVAAYEGQVIKVRVSFTDDAGNNETLTSAGTAAVSAANTPATGAPAISGTAQVGETLTANTSGVADVDGLSNVQYEYQWLANDSDISGATNATYTLVAAYEGQVIKVRASFTDDAGNNETLTSAGTGAVAAANTPATGAPTIIGTAQVGEALTVDTSGIADAEGLTNVLFTYQWLADDADINGAIGSTHTMEEADEGKRIKVKVSFTDAADNEETLTSVATTAVAGAAPAISGAPSYITVEVTEDSSDPINIVTNFTITWSNDSFCSVGYNAYLTTRTGDETEGSQLHLSSAASDGAQITAGLTGVQGGVFGFDVELYCGTDESGRLVSRRFISTTDGRPRPHIYSSEPPLSALSVSHGTFIPTFNSYTSDYTIPDVANADTRITITAIPKIGYAVEFFESSGNGAASLSVYSPGAGGSPSGLSSDCNRSHFDALGPLIELTDADPNTAGFQVDLYDGENHVEVAVYPTEYCAAGTGYGLAITRAEGSISLIRPNRPPIGLPGTGWSVIVGGPIVGYTRSAAVSHIRDRDGMANATFSYQWLADDAEITGAISSSYTVATADVGKTLKVRVSFTDDRGTVETLTSRATKVVKLRNFNPTGKPIVLGTLEVGQTLRADVSGISDRNGMTNATFSYQWTRSYSYIAGASADFEEYTLVDRDAGRRIMVIVNYTDDAGHDEEVTSEFTGEVAPQSNSPATGDPTISGTAQVGETLAAETSGINDDDGLDNVAYTYQWLSSRDTEIQGATDRTYTLAATDEGKAIKVRVSFTDNADNEETLTSAATDAVAAAPTTNTPATGAPTISGTAQVGETLTANTSGIADADGLSTVQYEYQWLADDAEIAGATSLTYTLVAADEGKAIKVEVSFTDDAGNEETLTSAATEAVAAAPTPNSPATGAPTISGTAQVGETLTANTSEVADSDGLSNVQYEYQWLADDAEISGATGSTYTVAAADEGKAIKVEVSFTDDAGDEEALTSAATDAVSAEPTPNSPATGAPAITGTTQVGETLTADTSGIADADGLSSVQYEYQWLADDAGISGATNATYTLADADEGKAVKVEVSFTDDAGNKETLTSAATDGVATAEPSEPPDKPKGLEATTTHGQVVLTWDDPEDDSITGYVILRRVRVNDQGGDFSVLVANTGSAATTYTDNTVAASTTYTYRIKAINEHGVSERSRWVHIDTPAPPVPDQPTGLEATASHGQVVLTWDDPEDDSITGYVILRRVRVNDTGGDFSVLVANTESAATTYADNTVAASTTYTYRIKAINEHGTSERSRWYHISTPAAP